MKLWPVVGQFLADSFRAPDVEHEWAEFFKLRLRRRLNLQVDRLNLALAGRYRIEAGLVVLRRRVHSRPSSCELGENKRSTYERAFTLSARCPAAQVADCICWSAPGVDSDVEFGSLRDDDGVRRYTTGSATGTPSILMT